MTSPTSQNAPVRLALVGLGGHGRTVQAAAEAAASVAVASVYDPNGEEAALAARRFGCEAAPSYDALLARDDLDAVALCTPNHVHRPQAEAAFEAGLDVLVEKPIANTVADGLALAEAAEQAGRVLMVGHNMRFGAAVRWGHGLIASGRLGRIVSAEFHFSSDTALRLPVGSWRLHPERCPLLPMMQLGVHAVDLAQVLVGPVRSVSARARAVTTPAGVVDSVAALVEIEGGALGTVVSNYCSPVAFRFHVAGTEGALDGTPLVVTFTPRDGGPPETHDTSADPFASYVAQLDAFAAAVRDRTTPETDGWAATQALAVVEAMSESVASRAPVEVPLVRSTVPGHAV